MFLPCCTELPKGPMPAHAHRHTVTVELLSHSEGDEIELYFWSPELNDPKSRKYRHCMISLEDWVTTTKHRQIFTLSLMENLCKRDKCL